MIKVFKFGGALMKDAQGIEKVAAIIDEFSCEPLVVVVSAMGKSTNALEELLLLSFGSDEEALQTAYFRIKQFHLRLAQDLMHDDAHQLVLELEAEFVLLWDALNMTYSDKYLAYDQIVSFGENFAGIIIQRFLQYKGIGSQLIDARSLIVTNSNYTNAAINWKLTEKTIQSRILPALENNKVVLTQGFIGSDEKGQSTTLGREGSDFTAAVLAKVTQAKEVSIWKDVPGLMNCDPKRFAQAVKLHQISYHEAIELAFYGASIIHPKTIQPLQLGNIPLKIRSFYHPESEPSLVSEDVSHDSEIYKIIIKDKQVLLSIASRNLSFIAEENLTGIFEAFSRNKIHINLMQNSAVSFSVCFNEDAGKLKSLISDLGKNYLLKYNEGLQLITIRHYNDELISDLTKGKQIFLEQKSRSTVQFLVKSKAG